MSAVAHPAPPLSTTGEGFEELYRRAFPRVFGYVASLLGDRATAEDVTAQAFERAYRRRRTFRPSRGSAEAWLFGIARNAALDELRRRKRRAALVTQPADAATDPPDAEVEQLERIAHVRTALAGLTPRDRDLVALKFAGGLSNREIARVLRISESNVGTRLHRVVQQLREACHDVL